MLGALRQLSFDHLDALRVVAVDAGAIEWGDVTDADGDPPLTGDRFHEAYRLARTRYGAPLPV